MPKSIRQQLRADLKLYEKSGKKTPLLFLTSFLDKSINLSYICDLYRKSSTILPELQDKDKAVYYRFYRLFKRLEKEGLVVLSKPNNDMIFATAGKAFFDLLKQVQNSNSANTEKKPPFALPTRAREERIEAIKITLNTDMLTLSDKEEIGNYFDDYIDDINDRTIILERLMDEDEYGQRYFFLKYQTRFNSKAKKAELLDKYEAIIEETLARYKVAIHLVLTTDPKRHKSLWHANRHFSPAFNNFMSFLKKRLGYRPDYLTVYEFTKSGLLHAHVLIFGISYLIPHVDITREWEKCNQGSYNYIYALKRTKNGWQYKRERPTDSKKGQTADDYLKKYLKKAQYDDSRLFLYWTFNKRFFTNSRKLNMYVEKCHAALHRFRFVGSFNIFEIPAWVILDIPYNIETEAEPPPLYTNPA
ncbi:MAG: hypothetical protein DRO07_03330 [Candidatus Iainarchaeum archaeon]|uniref:Replication-associated protein ORF2/G2P domain-containing protein n=1 Tax=Candidatus Iainarchaeum sp. TaxID=3101447 RepID=A0A497JFE1_9ARCH|nr:MAG: hypothetical protein DRO07_03330 [Candidatus Diapherotrites archaeon]